MSDTATAPAAPPAGGALPWCKHCRVNRRKGKGGRGLCADCYADPEIRQQHRKKPIICHNCKQLRIPKARNLCVRCYLTPSVREKHGPTSPRGNKVLTFDTRRQRPLPAEPTDARPGSEEKIRVLMARVQARVQLHHPDDAKLKRSSTDDVDLSAELLERLAYARRHQVESVDVDVVEPHDSDDFGRNAYPMRVMIGSKPADGR